MDQLHAMNSKRQWIFPEYRHIRSTLLEILLFHSFSVLEFSPLFFGVSILIGILLKEFFIRFQISYFQQFFLILSVILFIWFLQERFSVISMKLRDPYLKKQLERQYDAPREESTTTTAPSLTEPPLPGVQVKAREFDTKQEEAIDIIIKRYFDKTNATFWNKTQYLCANDDARSGAIRALDARNWNVDAALILIENNLKWREKEKIDDVFSRPISVKDAKTIRLSMGDGFYGTDKRGYPIYWNPAGAVNLSQLKSEVSLPTLVTFHIQVMEYNQRVWFKELSQQQNRSIYQTTVVLDLKGFSSQNIKGSFWECMFAVTNIDRDYYYENINKVYILNAPSYFKFFWSMISYMLSAETKAKFIVLASPGDLHEFIDPTTIPIQFGGEYEGNDAVWTSTSISTIHADKMDAYIRDWKKSE